MSCVIRPSMPLCGHTGADTPVFIKNRRNHVYISVTTMAERSKWITSAAHVDLCVSQSVRWSNTMCSPTLRSQPVCRLRNFVWHAWKTYAETIPGSNRKHILAKLCNLMVCVCGLGAMHWTNIDAWCVRNWWEPRVHPGVFVGMLNSSSTAVTEQGLVIKTSAANVRKIIESSRSVVFGWQ